MLPNGQNAAVFGFEHHLYRSVVAAVRAFFSGGFGSFQSPSLTLLAVVTRLFPRERPNVRSHSLLSTRPCRLKRLRSLEENALYGRDRLGIDDEQIPPCSFFDTTSIRQADGVGRVSRYPCHSFRERFAGVDEGCR